MKNESPKEIIRPTRQEQVLFKDGMIVTAEALQAATNYPLSVFQTLIRAFLGCGIVCGIKVEPVPESTACEYDGEKKNAWCVKINPGVALDCQGYPLELCQPVQIDLTPDPCSCDTPPTCVCIAIRRYIEEDPQIMSNCKGGESEQSYDCTRKREYVKIKVFECDDKLPENICMRCLDAVRQQERQSEYNYSEQACLENFDVLCDCLKSCPDHHCCGEGWVLLACIELGECGIERIDNKRRKYVKPIDCLCPEEEKESLYKQDEVEKKAKASDETKVQSIEPAKPPAEKPKRSGRK